MFQICLWCHRFHLLYVHHNSNTNTCKFQWFCLCALKTHSKADKQMLCRIIDRQMSFFFQMWIIYCFRQRIFVMPAAFRRNHKEKTETKVIRFLLRLCFRFCIWVLSMWCLSLEINFGMLVFDEETHVIFIFRMKPRLLILLMYVLFIHVF